MIVLGVILLITGFVLAIPILWTIGVLLAVIGLALWILGSMGPPGREPCSLLLTCGPALRRGGSTARTLINSRSSHEQERQSQGKTKEALGNLTGNDRLKREGKADQAKRHRKRRG